MLTLFLYLDNPLAALRYHSLSHTFETESCITAVLGQVFIIITVGNI